MEKDEVGSCRSQVSTTDITHYIEERSLKWGGESANRLSTQVVYWETNSIKQKPERPRRNWVNTIC